MRSRLTVALGRTARLAARVRGGGSGGTAFPGLVMERTDPGFLERTLGRLPRGVIVVSGTNGKTTTTKMVVQLLREQGLNEKQMRGKIDMIAASLFLQTWLDRKNEEVQHA